MPRPPLLLTVLAVALLVQPGPWAAGALWAQPAETDDDDDGDDDAVAAVPDPDDAAGGGDDGAAAGADDDGPADDAVAATGGSDDGAGSDDDDSAAGASSSNDDGDDDDGHAGQAGGGSDPGDDRNDDDRDDDGASDDRDDDAPAGPGAAVGDDDDDADDNGRVGDAGPARYAGVEDARTRSRLDRLEAIDSDDDGFRYRRGEVLALGVDAAAVARLQRAGFRLIERHRLLALGGDAVLVAAPARIRDVDALVQVDGLIGGASHGFNHLYDRSAALVRGGGKAARPKRQACPCRIGVIDTGVAGTLPDLKRTRLVQQAFNGGQPDPALHGTVISSIIAGTEPAPGSRTEILVGDVFSGPRGTAGSALAVVRALDWLATQKVAVINVSLSGAANPVLADAIARLAARGHVIVAAAGNDGPAAPPAFPAAYPGVVAVTAVDENLGVYRYANRGSYIAFAARGVDVVGLAPDGGTRIVSGTSFAAPSVAIRLASMVKAPDPVAARTALTTLAREARDLGAPGRDPVFGAGLIGDRP